MTDVDRVGIFRRFGGAVGGYFMGIHNIQEEQMVS